MLRGDTANCGDLPCQYVTEQRRDFRRSNEIPGGAKFRRAGHVIAQAGRIERMLHVIGKTDAAALFLNLLTDMISNSTAVSGTFLVGFRKLESCVTLWLH